MRSNLTNGLLEINPRYAFLDISYDFREKMHGDFDKAQYTPTTESSFALTTEETVTLN